MLLKNFWYVAAWDDEVNAQPRGRTILGEPIVLYRTPDGRAHALQDRCAHRRMPLAHAKLIGETLVCSYHGLAYAPTGACVRVPGQENVPSTLRVRSFPTIERYGAVWIWIGDPVKADPDTIFECDEVPASGGGHRFYFRVKANYLLLNDNLSDLLHQAYLHNPSFGGNANPLGEFAPSVLQEGNRITVKWDWKDVVAPGAFAEAGNISGKADGWNHSCFSPPSFYSNRPGFAAAGTGGFESPLPQGAGKIGFTVYQLITPETEKTTHFFKIVACQWPDHLLPKLSPFIVDVNKEDIWACEEQQRMADLAPNSSMHAIATDAPVVRMRQILQRLHAEEQPASHA